MEFLRAFGRFILVQLAILGFLLLAPAILVGVSLFAISGGAGSNPGFLAFFYMAAGPFVSAVWTAFFMSLRRVLRTTTPGNRTAASCGMRVQIAGCGWALVGFLGTIAAEVAFNLAFRAVSKSPTVYFALAPFAVFAPLLLLWAWSSFKRARGESDLVSGETR
jgi:hypothetical protein